MKLTFKYGILTFLVLVIYFLICHIAGLTSFLELRFFNGLVLLVFVCMALKKRYAVVPKPSYVEGIGIALGICAVASILFTVMVWLFLTNNETFMNHLIIRAPFGKHLTPFLSAVAIFAEGFGSGVVISFAAMQYFKKAGAKY